MQLVIKTRKEYPDADILVVLPNHLALRKAKEILTEEFPEVENIGGSIFDNIKGEGGTIFLKLLGDVLGGLRFDFIFVDPHCRKCGNSESRILQTEAYLDMLTTKIVANGYGGVLDLCE